MVVKLQNIKKARDQGISEDRILDSISRTEESLSEGITRARDAGASESDILRRIESYQERGVVSDVATQAVTSPVTGILGAPRAAGETVKFGADLITKPKETIEGTLRNIFGMGPPQEEKPADTFGGRLGQKITGKRVEDQSPAQFLLGEEGAQQAKEMTGLQALEDFSGMLAGKVGDFFSAISEGPFGRLKIEDLPTRKDARDSLSEFLEVDLDPQTAGGRLVEDTIGTYVENAPMFGGKIAGELAKARTVGNLAREVGLPESVATPIEILSILASGKRPPAKEVVKKGIELTEEELSEFAQKIEKPPQAKIPTGEPPPPPPGEPPPGEPPPGEPPSRGTAKFEYPPEEPPPPSIKFDEPVKTSDILETIEAETKGPLLNTLAPEVDVEVGLQKVAGEVGEKFTRERGKTSNLYDETTFMLEDQQGIFPTTVGEIDKVLEEVETAGISGPGKQIVINEAKNLRAALEEGIELKDAIKREQNFGSLFDFEFPDLESRAKASKVFSPVRKALSRELGHNLQAVNPDAYVSLRKAKRSHRNNVERFGKDSVIKLQRGESVLDSRGALSRPQDIEWFKNALGEDSHFNTVLDRLVLDEMDFKGLSKKNRKDIDLMKKRLTPRGQNILEELVELSDPSGVVRKTQELQRRILDDVTNAHLSGTTPEVTLKMMQNPQGLQLVRSTLNRSASGKEALKNMENLFVRNVFDQLFKDGELNIQAAKDLVRNRELFNSLKMIAPEEAEIVKDLSSVIPTPKKIEPKPKKIEPKPTILEERTKGLKKTILEDAITNKILGRDPKKTLDLMQTPEGVDLVRNTLNSIKDGKALIKEFETTFIQNVFKDLFKDGKINLSEAKKLIKNKSLMNAISKVNPEAGKLLRRLPELTSSIEKSLINTTKNQAQSILDNPGKFLSGMLVLKALGVPLGKFIIFAKGAEIAKNVLPKIMKNPKIPRLLKIIEKNPNALPTALAEITKIVEREESPNQE
tara:strand:+ start:13087 stop:16023 length:2937 start_codon:yes stop_codon:yes gene_type:complete